MTRQNAGKFVKDDQGEFVTDARGEKVWYEHPSITSLRDSIDAESDKLDTVKELVPIRWLEALESLEKKTKTEGAPFFLTFVCFLLPPECNASLGLLGWMGGGR